LSSRQPDEAGGVRVWQQQRVTVRSSAVCLHRGDVGRLFQIRKAALGLRFEAVKHIRKHKEYEAAWVQDDIEQQYP